MRNVIILCIFLLAHYTSCLTDGIKEPPPFEAKVHAPKQNAVTSYNPLMHMSDNKITLYVKNLIKTESFEEIAQMTRGVPVEYAEKLITLVSDFSKGMLSVDQKIKLFLAILHEYKDSLASQHDLLNFLASNPDLHQGSPLLFIAAYSQYAHLIPIIRQWAEQFNSRTPIPYIKNMDTDSFTHAVKKNMPSVMTLLYKANVPLQKSSADQLTWRVVDENKNPAFIPELIALGASLDQVRDNKYTPLIKATINGNMDLVKALVQAGATTNMVPDDETGSALQIAIEKGLVEIEMILREHHAEEIINGLNED